MMSSNEDVLIHVIEILENTRGNARPLTELGLILQTRDIRPIGKLSKILTTGDFARSRLYVSDRSIVRLTTPVEKTASEYYEYSNLYDQQRTGGVLDVNYSSDSLSPHSLHDRSLSHSSSNLTNPPNNWTGRTTIQPTLSISTENSQFSSSSMYFNVVPPKSLDSMEMIQQQQQPPYNRHLSWAGAPTAPTLGGVREQTTLPYPPINNVQSYSQLSPMSITNSSLAASSDNRSLLSSKSNEDIRRITSTEEARRYSASTDPRSSGLTTTSRNSYSGSLGGSIKTNDFYEDNNHHSLSTGNILMNHDLAPSTLNRVWNMPIKEQYVFDSDGEDDLLHGFSKNMMQGKSSNSEGINPLAIHDLKNCPIFTRDVLQKSDGSITTWKDGADSELNALVESNVVFSQYGLFGEIISENATSAILTSNNITGNDNSIMKKNDKDKDSNKSGNKSENQGTVKGRTTTSSLANNVSSTYRRVYFNTAHSFSTVILGVQGSGKSHTLSTILEDCLIPGDRRIGRLKYPFSGIVCHFDECGNLPMSMQPCEAARLSVFDGDDAQNKTPSAVQVTVYVSPSNLETMQSVYSRYPSIIVRPLILYSKEISARHLLKIISPDCDNEEVNISDHTIMNILKKIGDNQFNLTEFKKLLQDEPIPEIQKASVGIRLNMFEKFLDTEINMTEINADISVVVNIRESFKSGSLVIFDLTDPFVSQSFACSIFETLIQNFVETPTNYGKVVVLDDIHKFITPGKSSRMLTEYLISLVRQQRHLSVSTVISTQDPTCLPPALLDICPLIVVHRFNSPYWWGHLSKHIGSKSWFESVMRLHTGEAMVFAPSGMMMSYEGDDDNINQLSGEVVRMGFRCIRVRIRKRITSEKQNIV